MHLDPRRLVEVVGDDAALDQLADDAGLEHRILRDAWSAERRLDRPALQRLAEAVHLAVEVLSCRHSPYRGNTPPCPACEAANEIDDQLLCPAVERVTAFLVDARQSVPGLRGGSPPLTPQSRTVSPEFFTSGPEFAAAAVAVRRLGGDLTAADLAQTGDAGLLGSEEQFDPQSVGADLARYAARGDVECLDLVGLNACDLPDGPVPIAGWELVRLGQSGVRDLMPVPAAADFMPSPGWNLTAAAETWWLRRFTGHGARSGSDSLILDLSARALHEHAPAPLLVLALADDAAIQPLSRYVVERGEAVHRIGGNDLDYDYLWQDEPPEFDAHMSYVNFGGGRRSQAEWPKWRRFCEVVGPMVEGSYQKSCAGHQGAERLIRATGHFLEAVMDAGSRPADRYRTVLDLSVALEILLVAGKPELSLQFRNGAAWLGGRKDVEREAIRTCAKTLYDAGSNYRGSLCEGAAPGRGWYLDHQRARRVPLQTVNPALVSLRPDCNSAPNSAPRGAQKCDSAPNSAQRGEWRAGIRSCGGLR